MEQQTKKQACFLNQLSSIEEEQKCQVLKLGCTLGLRTEDSQSTFQLIELLSCVHRLNIYQINGKINLFSDRNIEHTFY